MNEFNESLRFSSKRVKLDVQVVPVEKRDCQQLYPVKEKTKGVDKGLMVKDASRWSREAIHTERYTKEPKEEVSIDVIETALIIEDTGAQKSKKYSQTKSSQPCLFCDDSFQNKGLFRKHVSQAHSDLKQCALCGQIFATVKVHFEHLYQYHKEKNVQCQICIGLKGTKRYQTSLHLVKHIRKVHSQTENAKKMTTKQNCSTISNKEQSVKFLGVRNVCKLCYVGYKSLKMLEKHFQAIHSIPLPTSSQSVLFNATRYCCNLCPKVYQVPGYLQQHFRRNKHNECSICTKRYLTEKGLMLHHIRVHNKCPRAKESFADEESYIHHLSSKHHYCSICFERFCSTKDSRNHFRKKHHDGQRNECNTCGKKFSCVSTAKTHMARKTCQRIKFQIKFRVMKSLKKARQRAGLAKICYSCKFCNSGSESLDMMKMHLKFCHRPTIGKEISDDIYEKYVISSSKVFYCKQCPRVFSSYVGYVKHMKGKQHLYCKACLKHVKTETALIIHQLRMHDIRCTISPEVFSTEEQYNQHLTQQHHVCDMCLITFCTSKRLYEHKNVVHEIKKTNSYCNICGKRFVTHSGVAYHMKRQHNPEGTQYCKVCKSYFMTKNALLTHLSVSTCRDGVREFACSFCSKKYRSYVARHRHIMKCHKVFVCLMCASNHISMEQLDQHQKLCTNLLKVEPVLN